MEEGKEERKRRRRKGRGCPKRTTVLNHRTPQPSSRGEESQCPHLRPMEWCTSKLKASATHIRTSHSRSFFHSSKKNTYRHSPCPYAVLRHTRNRQAACCWSCYNRPPHCWCPKCCSVHVGRNRFVISIFLKTHSS